MKGTLDKVGDRFVLRFERIYPHPCEAVWQALIEPESLAEWFPAAIVGERRAGAKLRFVFEGGEGPALEGEVRVFEAPHRLEYSWHTDVLRWELTPTREGCRLVFTTTVEQRSNAARDATGWEGCLEHLAAVVAGQPPPPPAPERFPSRYREYVAAFGAGAFPEFLIAAPTPSTLLPNPALAGTAFDAPGGVRLELLQASVDAETEEHALGADAYLFVLEGSYELRLGEQALAIGAGTEFHVPGGGRVSGRVTAGTRLIYAATRPT